MYKYHRWLSIDLSVETVSEISIDTWLVANVTLHRKLREDLLESQNVHKGHHGILGQRVDSLNGSWT